ncbi:hypothetical protein JN11_00477 [Mucilaginibacter frigoritolerans]|uniref:GLPGLI family protein n=1 Tax=Mucilaginibacter frigoritolerans TaxID=652788 RepID=A0A562UFZ0_9SPHI|nr:hypothetical protein [Mucilaginibacter frigoritolerans]TWJ04756.1 hypothetical protein JN11_00477 [Mucilaginibacter frigoritolerans]
MKTLFTITFITSILFALTAKAQHDYVITAGDDSLTCEINVRLLGVPKYQAKGAKESKKIRPDEIKEYYIADQDALFKSVLDMSGAGFNENPRLFMPVLEKGKICLYQMIYSTPGTSVGVGLGPIAIGGGTSTIKYYVSKIDDWVSEVKTDGIFTSSSKLRIKNRAFLNMIEDNKEVYNKCLADNDFSFKAIRNLIHLYNTGTPYKDPPYVEPKEDSSNGFNPNQD